MAITQSSILPQQFKQDLQQDYGQQLAGLTSIPLDTSQFAPSVAAQDPLQTQAIGIAQGGVGVYKPYLTAAQQAQTDASTTLGGLGSMQAGAQGFQTAQAGATGANAYQPFMSPYQQQVIDATLSEFDKSRLSGQQQINSSPLYTPNTFISLT